MIRWFEDYKVATMPVLRQLEDVIVICVNGHRGDLHQPGGSHKAQVCACEPRPRRDAIKRIALADRTILTFQSHTVSRRSNDVFHMLEALEYKTGLVEKESQKEQS